MLRRSTTVARCQSFHRQQCTARPACEEKGRSSEIFRRTLACTMSHIVSPMIPNLEIWEPIAPSNFFIFLFFAEELRAQITKLLDLHLEALHVHVVGLSSLVGWLGRWVSEWIGGPLGLGEQVGG